jgi:hypothetical protein
MSLALWEFFWDWDGTPAPSPAPTPPPPPASPLPGPPEDSGGGGGKGWGKGGKPRQHLPSPEDLWEVRERYLRSIQPPPPPAPRPEEYESEANRLYLDRQQQLEQAASDRAAAVLALRSAPDIKTMKRLGATIKELNAKIATLTAKQSFARFMK